MCFNVSASIGPWSFHRHSQSMKFIGHWTIIQSNLFIQPQTMNYVPVKDANITVFISLHRKDDLHPNPVSHNGLHILDTRMKIQFDRCCADWPWLSILPPSSLLALQSWAFFRKISGTHSRTEVHKLSVQKIFALCCYSYIFFRCMCHSQPSYCYYTCYCSASFNEKSDSKEVG
jgi:hypothetical protein